MNNHHHEETDNEEETILYSTDGQYIVDAVSGVQTQYLVGSNDELRFWKIADVSLRTYDEVEAAGRILFYSSPEAYEDIRNLKLDKNMKIAWREKKSILKK